MHLSPTFQDGLMSSGKRSVPARCVPAAARIKAASSSSSSWYSGYAGYEGPGSATIPKNVCYLTF